MVEKTKDKQNGPSKSFMAIGPTLHYSHANVRLYWGLAIFVYFLTCLFWTRLLTGSLTFIDITGLFEVNTWGLDNFIIYPLSIYEYPWQILILGLLMGILAITPVLVSQLLSYKHSLLMILFVIFVARLPLFGFFMLISCLAVSCRPLRFRSRIISIVLCLAPQLVYWAIYGGYESVDPLKWGFSFAPWVCAWIIGLSMAGIVLAIGHFTRYRPGLIWSVCLINLLLAAGLFQWQIGFAELDYQLYIAGNNPEEISEFHDHDLSKIIDSAMQKPGTKSFLAGFFYPKDPKKLRDELVKDIQIRLADGRWPNWLDVPIEINFQVKRQWLINQYDKFIEKRPLSGRMPIALYYKAIVNEYSPDIRLFGQSELIRFYKDYPHEENLAIWYKLYDEFSLSPESIEARWRLAVHLAGQSKFDTAKEFCEVAEGMIERNRILLESTPSFQDDLLNVFLQPPKTIMTPFKLDELKLKLLSLKDLISEQNRNETEESRKRLARFVLLNPHSLGYEEQLDILLSETDDKDPLRDNIELANALIITNPLEKLDKLTLLTERFNGTDAGTQAYFEMGILNYQLGRDTSIGKEQQQHYLEQARQIFANFIAKYPESILRRQAMERLSLLQ